MKPSAATLTLYGLVGGFAIALKEYSPPGPDATAARSHEGVTDTPAIGCPPTVSTTLPLMDHVLAGTTGGTGVLGAGLGAVTDRELPPQPTATTIVIAEAESRPHDLDKGAGSVADDGPHINER
jgi:hypothetical protein